MLAFFLDGRRANWRPMRDNCGSNYGICFISTVDSRTVNLCSLSDEELIQQLAPSGDSGCLAELVRRHYQTVAGWQM